MIPFMPAESAPTFDHPLEMLHACHGKILRQCDLLEKLVAHMADNGCDEQARQAAQGILRYFDSAGQFHHLDEEEDLFPALRLSSGVDREQLESLLERLLSEHVKMLAAWDALRPILLRIAGGAATRIPEAVKDAFISRYTNHIAVEEGDLLPLAARLLDPSRLAPIGQRMAERRGAPATRR